MRFTNIFCQGLILSIFIAIDSEMAEISVSNSKSGSTRENKSKEPLFSSLLNSTKRSFINFYNFVKYEHYNQPCFPLDTTTDENGPKNTPPRFRNTLS